MSTPHKVSGSDHWFGWPPLVDAIMAWGFRAIFKQDAAYPLDIVFNRQGHDYREEQHRDYQQFAGHINEHIIPTLQEIAKGYYSDGKHAFTWHFDWPHDPNLVIVAQGSPNGSYGYFYMAVNLIEKSKAPEVVRPQGYITPEEFAAAEARRQEMIAKSDAERARHRNHERQVMRGERERKKKRLAEFAQRFNKAPFKKPGQPLFKGDGVKVYANQGDRDGIVRAVIDSHAVIEYQMPNGVTYLREITCDKQADVRPISPNKVPKKWQDAMKD